MHKIFRLIIICLFLIGFFVSCEKAENPSDTTLSNENILRIDMFGAFSTLNPADTNLGGSGSATIFPLLYSYLCVPDEFGKLKPDLALSWKYDPEKFIWNISLRENAFFHDGRKVTSKDVTYALLDSGYNNISSSLMESVQKIIQVSDIRLLIFLNKDDPDFIEKIWSVCILPHPDDSMTDDSEQANNPVGSGPFQFVSKTSDQKVVLSANKKYYNGLTAIERVEFNYEPDRGKSWTRLLAGETDIAYEMTPKNYELMKQYEDRFYFDHYTMHRYSIVLYNTHDSLFSDPRIRQALTHAIDRDYIVKHMLRGYGKVACGPMGIDSPYHNPNVVPLPYDPRKSLDLLQQAGWAFDRKGHYLYKDNKLFRFTLSVIGEFPLEQAVARYIKLCFNDIGIQMNIDLVPLNAFAEKYRQNNAFQAVLTEFIDGYRRVEFLKELWSPSYCEKSKAGCFEHPEVTSLLEQAFSSNDPAQKIQCLQKADSLISSLQPGTFLFHKTAIDVMSKRFFLPAPFELTDQGIYRLKDASLIQQ